MGYCILILVLGFVSLYVGAEWLVKGASRLARLMGLSPLLIGLTVVAFGTSAPELLVSLISAMKGKNMIAVGNVVGSNICNIALVLGIASLFRPITCRKEIIKRDIPVMIIISIYLIIISLDSKISRLDGISLFLSLIVYTIFNYYGDKKRQNHIILLENIKLKKGINKSTQLLLIAAGILLVVAGAKIVVSGAETIMRMFGISERVIGLSIVAFGTSLPELATSTVASYRRHIDISIGNLIGSNAFNIMCVLGLTSVVKPIFISGGFFKSGIFMDYIIMIFISIIPWVMIKKEPMISRKHGLILLGFYIAYIFYLYLSPTC